MKTIAVLTSGGDSAGMNAAVRAVTRMALSRSCRVYVIRDGWQGLVNGNPPEYNEPQPTSQFSYGHSYIFSAPADTDPYIVPVRWDDLRSFLAQGGTAIGTARCADFRTQDGRRKAALNLVRRGIDGLVIIGGDGSLTGADVLRHEWPDLLAQLCSESLITQDIVDRYPVLNIAGLVGSIDNDLAMTDITIGAETALHRICEAMDAISSTAASHSRAFVIEVMGRHCGWLALMAAIAGAADFLFIPERPPTDEQWANEMCRVLHRHRQMGKRKSLIIVAEGATDKHLNPITASMIEKVLSERLKLDTRVTTLGHTQRGGSPCAYDRVLATLQGCDAVNALLEPDTNCPSPVIAMCQNRIVRQPLVEAVRQTQEITRLIEQDRDFDKAVRLRNSEFAECLYSFKATTRLNDFLTLPPDQTLRIGIMHMGAPAGGMNAATVAAARYCLARGHTPLGIFDSWNGLLEDRVRELSWIKVDPWATRGGSELGTNRQLPEDAAKIGAKLAQHKIDALLIIGGYEVYKALAFLAQQRSLPGLKISHRRGLSIPMLHLPATISNNVPITEWSLGSDTSVNILMQACDMAKQSASASRNRVFVIECQGGYCGYMATVGGLASGACAVYTPEHGVNLERIAADAAFLRKRYAADEPGRSEGRLVIMNEKASAAQTWSTSVVKNVLAEEGAPLFDSRMAVMGHTLQGGIPSPRDRARGVRLAIRAVQYLELGTGKIQPKNLWSGADPYEEFHLHGQESTTTKEPSSPSADFYGLGDCEMGVVTVRGTKVSIASLDNIAEQSDEKNRRPKYGWWEDMFPVMAVMAGRDIL